MSDPLFLSSRTLSRIARIEERFRSVLSSEQVVAVAVAALDRLTVDDLAMLTDDDDAVEFSVDCGNPFQITLL